MPLLPTQRLQGGRFVLLGLLKAGGEAEVWRALDTERGAERALKVYPAGDGGAVAAARELALARRLAHAHVVRVEDAFVEDDHAFVVMELAEGSLAERVATLGPLSPAEALEALAGPLAALAEAHGQGIVHRDLKPHNLLVFGDLGGTFGARGTATVKLADFGIAQLRAEGVTRTRSGALLGSLPFMSPEQRRDPKRVGPATDVYAAAVTLVWLLLGEVPDEPWTDDAQRVLRARGVPAGLRDVIARAGARRPEERHADAGVLGGAIGGDALLREACMPQAAEMAASARIGTAVPQTRMNVAGYRGRIAIAVAAITAAIGTGAWLRALERGAVADRRDTEHAYPPCPDRPEYWTPRTELGPRESTASNIRDVDGDGHNDVLFTNTLDETVTIWWGTGRTHPTERTDVPIGRSGGAVAVEDVNNDGLRDLVGNMPDEAAIAEVLATGLRTFGAPRRHLQGPSGHDLMLVPAWPGQSGPQLLFRIPGLCVATRTRLDTGTWLPHTCISGPADVLSYGVADTNTILAKRGPRWFRVTDGTARPEADDAAVVLNDAGGVRFLGIGADLVRVNVDGSRCQWATPTGIMAPAIGDLDGDRRPDVVGTRTCQGCTSNHVFLYSSAAI